MHSRVWILGYGDSPTAPASLPETPLECNALRYTYTPNTPMTHKDAWKYFERERKRTLTVPVQDALMQVDWDNDLVLWQGVLPILGVVPLHGHGNRAVCSQCKKRWAWPPMAVPGSLSPESKRVKSMHTQASYLQGWDIEKVDRLTSYKCGDCAAPLYPDAALPGQEIAEALADKAYAFIRKHAIEECVVVDADLRNSYARCMVRMCRGKGARITHVTSSPEEYTWHKMRESNAVRDGVSVARLDQRMEADALNVSINGHA